MLSKSLKIHAVIFALISGYSLAGFAEAAADVDQEVTQIEEIKTKDEVWTQHLKDKYALTDEQIKTLKDSGISYPHLAMVAQLSKSSEKPLEDVLKMRTEQKMGWGKIAKELGVHPKEIGQSVRDLKHSIRDERQEERKIARAERKEKAAAKKEERKEARQDKHASRKGH